MLAEAPLWLQYWARSRNEAARSPDATIAVLGEPPAYLKNRASDAPSVAAHLEEALKTSWNVEEEARLRSALSVIPAIDRDVWLRVGMAIHDAGWGERGFCIWRDWSQTAPEKYNDDDQARTWESFNRRSHDGPRVTLASIYHMASERGWNAKPSDWKFQDQASGDADYGTAEGGGTSKNNSTSADRDSAGSTSDKTGERATVDDDKAARDPGVKNANFPIIEVKGGGLSNEATAGEEAILQAGHQVYRRGTKLVRPIIEEVDATRDRKTKVAQLTPISQPFMLDLLCKSAQWVRHDARKKKRVRINPSKDVAQIILNRSGQWAFEPVAGVITTQTLRPNGSLLVTPGYDVATRLILVAPPSMPNIPERPTRDSALAALRVLDSLLDEFPFADNGASRSVALSCLITPVVRGAFTVAPLHAARAPTAGTGKSFLFDIAAAIAIGQPCPTMAAGRTEEETEKRLGAALLAGQPILNIDNVNGELGGDALCQIIERPIVEIRILGKSERVQIEARCTVFATGNNLRLVGDMTRRVLLCMLDARQERPELRQFKRDPVAEVLANRGRYIAAVLTLVRAYVTAGKPNPAPRLASFEGWSDMVRSPLIWLGCEDPVQTMETARNDDPDLQAMQAVFAALKVTIGIGPKNAIAAAEIIKRACHVQSSGGVNEQNSELKDSLLAVAGDRGVIDARRLGKWFSQQKGRIANGLRLERKADRHGHAALWWLASCG